MFSKAACNIISVEISSNDFWQLLSLCIKIVKIEKNFLCIMGVGSLQIAASEKGPHSLGRFRSLLCAFYSRSSYSTLEAQDLGHGFFLTEGNCSFT